LLALLLVPPVALGFDDKSPADVAHLATLRAERQALIDADEQFAWLAACEKAGTGCPMGLGRPPVRRGCSALCLLRIERERSQLRRAEIDREITAIEARLARHTRP
jgi:hypothetical protein